MVCAFGTYRVPSSMRIASTVRSIVTRDGFSNIRNPIYTFEVASTASYEIIGPPAYNQDTRSLFLFVATHNNTAINSPFAIRRLLLHPDTSQLLETSIVYTHFQAVGLAKSSIVGASIRRDTNTLVAVDENFRRIYIFSSPSMSSILYTTSYDAATYKDLEFVGKDASKMFFTSFSITVLRAELYVQCAPCRDNGITFVGVPAESEADCFCRPGYYTTPSGGCSPCQCDKGEYQSDSGQQCLTGRDTSKVTCRLCARDCSAGQFVANTDLCNRPDNTLLYNPTECRSCDSKTCPSSLLTACTESKWDCIRGQAFAYPFDGWDLTTDLGPRRAHLIPVSASSRSPGPSVAITNATRTSSVAAFFNASNHEYFVIPPLTSLFSSSTSSSSREMTLSFWIRFASFSSSTTTTILEIGNGYNTENVCVHFVPGSFGMAFSISHSASFVQRELMVSPFQSLNLTQQQQQDWIHVAWTIEQQQQQQFSPCIWTIFFNGIPVQRAADGVYPLEATYSFNYIGYGSNPASRTAFFTGAMDDLRLYDQRALRPAAIQAMASMEPCCQLSLVAGAFIDPSAPDCTGRETFNPRLCRPCLSDCGPLQYIFSKESVCKGQQNYDNTECKPCQKCRADQYIGKLCAGTSYDDETECQQCRYTRSLSVHFQHKK